MRGYEEILQVAGYTEKEGTYLRFPGSVLESDRTKLHTLANELMMAKQEVERMDDKDTKLILADLSAKDSGMLIDS